MHTEWLCLYRMYILYVYIENYTLINIWTQKWQQKVNIVFSSIFFIKMSKLVSSDKIFLSQGIFFLWFPDLVLNSFWSSVDQCCVVYLSCKECHPDKCIVAAEVVGVGEGCTEFKCGEVRMGVLKAFQHEKIQWWLWKAQSGLWQPRDSVKVVIFAGIWKMLK